MKPPSSKWNKVQAAAHQQRQKENNDGGTTSYQRKQNECLLDQASKSPSVAVWHPKNKQKLVCNGLNSTMCNVAKKSSKHPTIKQQDPRISKKKQWKIWTYIVSEDCQTNVCRQRLSSKNIGVCLQLPTKSCGQRLSSKTA